MAQPTLVTLDVDWAPDWMIEGVAARLLKAGIRATFFATHDSPAMRNLVDEPSFELGLHPNLLPGSTHGTDADSVFATLRRWYPDARVCRTHSLVQSEPLLARMAIDFGIEVDCSLHLPRARHVTPHLLQLSDSGAAIIRLPHIFQDNMHALSGRPWDWSAAGLNSTGWRVMNFHPVHVALNTRTLEAYERLKRTKPLGAVQPTDLVGLQTDKSGTGTLFDEVLARLSGQQTWTVSEAVADWRAAGELI